LKGKRREGMMVIGKKKEKKDPNSHFCYATAKR